MAHSCLHFVFLPVFVCVFLSVFVSVFLSVSINNNHWINSKWPTHGQSQDSPLVPSLCISAFVLICVFVTVFVYVYVFVFVFVSVLLTTAGGLTQSPPTPLSSLACNSFSLNKHATASNNTQQYTDYSCICSGWAKYPHVFTRLQFVFTE